MTVPSAMQIEELKREAFNILPDMVNARQGAALAHASGISNNIPVVGRCQFENELAKEATWVSHNQSCHVHTLLPTLRGEFTSTPRRYPEENKSMARFNSRYEMKVAAQ